MNNFIANVVSISNLVPRIFLWRDPGNEVDQYLVYNIETDLKLILPRRVPAAQPMVLPFIIKSCGCLQAMTAV
jgi:hypothetical protein